MLQFFKSHYYFLSPSGHSGILLLLDGGKGIFVNLLCYEDLVVKPTHQIAVVPDGVEYRFLLVVFNV